MTEINLKELTNGMSLTEIGQAIRAAFDQLVPVPESSEVRAILMGQSEIEHIFNPGAFYDMTPVPDVTGTNMIVVRQDGTGNAPIEHEVTNANIAAGLVSEAMGALACYLRDICGSGVRFIIGDGAVPGTGRPSLADDSNTDRSWADFASVVSHIETNYGEVTNLIECWYNADAGGIANFKNNYWPLYFGVNPDGSTFNIGTLYTLGTINDYTVDHCLWDDDAATGEKGRGIFSDRTKWCVLEPMPFNKMGLDSSGVEWDNFSFDSTARLIEPARQVMRSLESEPEAQRVGLIVGPSAHITDFEGGIHPAENTDPDGKGLFAMSFAAPIATTGGTTISEPFISAVEGPESGAYADVVVNLPNGGELTTLRTLRSENVSYSKEFVQSLRHDKSTRGCRIPVSELKVPGVDTFPAGINYSAVNESIYVGDGVVVSELVGWDLSGLYFDIRGEITTIRDCVISEPITRVIPSLIDLYANARIRLVEWCDFTGNGAESNVGSAIWGRVSATSAGKVDVIRRCAFFNLPADVIKSRWDGVVVENYFDTPVNLAYEPLAWDSGTTYNTDDLVFTQDGQEKFAFISLIDSNLNNPPPTSKTSTAEWQNLDPHVDTLNPNGVFGGGVVHYNGNYVNQDNSDREYDTNGYGWGINQSLRFSDDAGISPIGSVSASGNIFARESTVAYPVSLIISSGSELLDNFISFNDGGDFIFPGTEVGNTVSGNVDYDGVRSILSPHKQDAVGFEVFRSSNSTRAPVMQEIETSYLINKRGRAVIVDNGSGNPKTGVVRIIPETPFEFGDSISYLRGQATAMLQTPRDVDSKLFLDMLIEHVPGYYNSSNDYSYEGVAVRPLQSDIAVNVPAPPFTARGAYYDGTNDALTATHSVPTGPRGMMSLLLKNDAASWTQLIQILQMRVSGDVKLEVKTTGTGLQINLQLADSSSPIQTFRAGNNDTNMVVGQWYHVLIAWDSTSVIIYVNDTHSVTMATGQDAFTGNLNQQGVGSASSTGSKWHGDLAHVWISTTQWLDITQQENRNKFVMNGAPQDLGPNGELVTGTAPEFYFDGDGAGWNNLGTAGSFNVTGELEASDSIPGYSVE